jgi:CheY-like chemotaxis protein
VKSLIVSARISSTFRVMVRCAPPELGVAWPSHYPEATAMSTLLLVNGEVGAQPGTEQRVGRRAPSMKGALERVGYEVMEVHDAATAFQRLGERPHLIVVAGTVPDMSLLDLCAALRKDPVAEKLPFVIVAEAAAKTGAVSKTGADLVFPPSVGPAEVADRLRRLF